jgi:hypothetical protein
VAPIGAADNAALESRHLSRTTVTGRERN